MKINIAIDGPSAAGKSTIAKRLATELGYVHIDTGAMYRCVAYKATNLNIDLDDQDALGKMIDETDIQLTSDGHVILDGVDVGNNIRTDEMSLAASKVSAHRIVRQKLVQLQQHMASNLGFIMDGRDIGTVVLKDAALKIYMVASAQARAERRYKQQIEAGIATSDLETIIREIEQRDYQDMHREESPLTKADDAIEIDTSDLTIEQVTNQILELARSRMKEVE